MYKQTSPLLLIPPEIRLQIYSYLLDDNGNQWLPISNKPAPEDDSSHFCNNGDQGDVSRSSSKYHVMEQTSMFHRRCYETTYNLACPEVEMHTNILAVCRLTYHEASDLLYGKHFFDFSHHIEAVVPFLEDRTPYTRSLLSTISVYKRGPLPSVGHTSDKHEWSYMCRFLSRSNTIRKLRLIVESGRPEKPWEGVQELSESNIRLLSLIDHESLAWAAELAQVKGLADLEIVPDVKYLPVPQSPAMAVYAALSASIEKGLTEFLRLEMNITN